MMDKKGCGKKRKMAIIEVTGMNGGRGWRRPLLAPGCGGEGRDLVPAKIPSLEFPYEKKYINKTMTKI